METFQRGEAESKDTSVQRIQQGRRKWGERKKERMNDLFPVVLASSIVLPTRRAMC